MSTKSDQRRDAIMQRMYAESSVRVKDLSEAFSVTEETIRQDLSRLEALGLCTRTHGGANLRQYSQVAVDIKAQEHAHEKNRLARAAMNRIKDDTTVWIGPGTTLSAMARYLPLRKNLLIVTNSLELACNARTSRHEILFLGGRIQKIASCSVGMFALDNLSHIQIDQAFIGCDGFVEGEGPTTFSFEEMEIHRRVMSLSKEKVLVCDASKFQHSGTYIYASCSDFDTLITTPLTEKMKETVKDIRELFEIE